MLSNVLLLYHAHRNTYNVFVFIIMILSFYCFLKTNQPEFYPTNKEGNISHPVKVARLTRLTSATVVVVGGMMPSIMTGQFKTSL